MRARCHLIASGRVIGEARGGGGAMDEDISALLAQLSDDSPSPSPFGGVYGGFESLEDILLRKCLADGPDPNHTFVPVVPGIVETRSAPKSRRRGRKKKERQQASPPVAAIVGTIPLPPLSCDGRGLVAVVACRKRHSPVEVEEVAREAAALVRTALQARQAYDALHTYSFVKNVLGCIEEQASHKDEFEEQKRAAVEAAEGLVAVAHLAPPRLARPVPKKRKKKHAPQVTA